VKTRRDLLKRPDERITRQLLHLSVIAQIPAIISTAQRLYLPRQENNRAGAMNTDVVTTTSLAVLPIDIFLMVNNFELGGTERQFTLLAQNLNTSRVRLHLGCLDRQGPLAEQLGSVPQFPMGGSLYGWQSLRTRFNLNRHLRSRHIQVAHSFDFYANLTLIPAARIARVPVIIGSHRQLGDLLTPAKFRALTAAFRWCDAVVCNSQAGADRLAAAGVSRKKLVVIGNALPPESFELTPAALPRRTGSLRVGMVARMNTRRKNHAGFLRIAAQIHQRVPNVEFLLVGDGPLRPEFEQQAIEFGLGDRVVFLGVRDDIPAVLASMDVAILTSDSESLSNAVLEAMAARLPVVAYNVGGNAELVNDQRGFLIGVKNEIGFANAVQRLLCDADLRLIASSGATRNFTRPFSKRSMDQDLPDDRDGPCSFDQAQGCHRRAKPALRWRTSRSGGPARALVAKRC
jgi:glycosyltransferase involved in cell wall biosynthesis